MDCYHRLFIGQMVSMDGYEKYVITSLWAYFCDATQGFFWELYGEICWNYKEICVGTKTNPGTLW